jgi:hypothetical protein
MISMLINDSYDNINKTGGSELTSMFYDTFKKYTSNEDEYEKHLNTELHRAITDIYNNKDNSNNALYKNVLGDKDYYFNLFKKLLENEKYKTLSGLTVLNEERFTPLHLAIKYDLIDVFKILINKNPGTIAYYTSPNGTAFMYALKNNKKEFINLLVSEDKFINAYYDRYNNPITNLYLAIENNDLNLFNFLIQQKNINIQTFKTDSGKYTSSILDIMCESCDSKQYAKLKLDFLKPLLNKLDFDLELKHHHDCLNKIINNDDLLIEFIKYLYSNNNKSENIKFNINHMFKTSKYNGYNLPETLIEKTILHMCIEKLQKNPKLLDFIIYLLENNKNIFKMDLNVKYKIDDKNIYTPLEMCILNTKIIYENNVDRLNNPEEYNIYENNLKIITLLLNNTETDVNTMHTYDTTVKNTPLHTLIYEFQKYPKRFKGDIFNIMHLLLKHPKIDVNIKNDDVKNYTPLLLILEKIVNVYDHINIYSDKLDDILVLLLDKTNLDQETIELINKITSKPSMFAHWKNHSKIKKDKKINNDNKTYDDVMKNIAALEKEHNDIFK